MVAVKRTGSGTLLSHAFSGELKAVGVVDKTIQDGVSEGGIREDLMMPPFWIVWYVGGDRTDTVSDRPSDRFAKAVP